MSRAEPAGFEFIDAVTSDVSFVAWAPSLEQLFDRAAAALLSVEVENPDAVRAESCRKVRLEEPDVELLLLRFLNELVYLRDAERLLVRSAVLEISAGAAGASLSGELRGEPIDPLRHSMATDVKAATAHQLAVKRQEGGWRAQVTLDV
jgi:SHS2 domain-containing protein